MFKVSLKTKAMASTLVKRAILKSIMAFSTLLLLATIPFFSVLFLVAATILANVLFYPWMGQAGSLGVWIVGKEAWVSGAVWLGLVAWIMFDATRMDWKFLVASQANKRPVLAAVGLLSWGACAFNSRFCEVMEVMGSPKPTMGAPKFLDPAPLSKSDFKGRWGSLFHCIHLYGYGLCKFPLFLLSFVEIGGSVAMMVFFLPLVTLDALSVWLYGAWASSSWSSWRAKAKIYGEGLLAEGAEDLARGEAAELGGKVRKIDKSAKSARL